MAKIPPPLVEFKKYFVKCGNRYAYVHYKHAPASKPDPFDMRRPQSPNSMCVTLMPNSKSTSDVLARIFPLHAEKDTRADSDTYGMHLVRIYAGDPLYDAASNRAILNRESQDRIHMAAMRRVGLQVGI